MGNDSKDKLLIVDDRPENLIALEAILYDEDIEIMKASSGNEALKAVINRDVSLVLLDIQMPDMNGFEVAEIMRSSPKTREIPIIFVTAINKEENYIFKGYELGAVDYIYKPIKNEIIKSKVKVFLKLQRQKRVIVEKAQALETKISELENAKKELKILNEKLVKRAMQDGLTGIANRLDFDETIQRSWNSHIEGGMPLSIMMLDIDFFKRYNDTYGHLAGDECLKNVAKSISSIMENVGGYVARYGGEEFSVLLFDTGISRAMEIAENIRGNIEGQCSMEFDDPSCKDTTISIGVYSTIPSSEMGIGEFIQSADKALYKAKENGRNRVEIFD